MYTDEKTVISTAVKGIILATVILVVILVVSGFIVYVKWPLRSRHKKQQNGEVTQQILL